MNHKMNLSQQSLEDLALEPAEGLLTEIHFMIHGLNSE